MISPWLTIVALLALGAPRQAPDLGPVAEQARQALAGHDVRTLLGASTRVLLQLPSAAPSAPVGRPHAEALLKAFLTDFEEVKTELVGVSPTGERSATVELRRTSRVPGTKALRTQSVLLAYQLIDGRWILTELKVTS